MNRTVLPQSRLGAIVRILLVGFLALLLILPLSGAAARPRGSFGGGGRSFGGSFGGGGGGSFGGGRSSGGSFGGGGGSFGGSSRSGGSFGGGSGSRSFGGGSFGRSGSFGGGGGIARSSSGGYTYNYGGRMAPVRGYGGFSSYSFYWGAPSWYYWTPFHPAFYWGPPVYMNGYYQPGGFSFGHLFISLIFFAFLFWLIIRLLTRGGGGGVRYTTYR